MTSKQSFKKLVENVGSLSRKSQEELATSMGYGKTYISEVLSPTGKLSEKFVTAFKNFYKDYLENPNQALGKIGSVEQNNNLPVGSLTITLEDYVKEIKDHNKFLQTLLLENISKIDANLSLVGGIVSKISYHVESAREVALKSLARIEKKPEGQLFQEAGNVVRRIMKESDKHRTGDENRR